MKRIWIVINCCYLIVSLLCFSSCKKDGAKTNITLYDKPLSVIKENIQGKWKEIYSIGGLASTTQYPKNLFYEFDNNNVKIINNGYFFADTTITWIHDLGTYTNGDSTFLMEFYTKQNAPSVYVVNKIYNDTLILNDYGSDPIFYYFIKQTP